MQAPFDGRLPMQAFVPVGLLSLKAAVSAAATDTCVVVRDVNHLINNGRIPNDDRFYDTLLDHMFQGNPELLGLMTDADSLAHTCILAKRAKQRAPTTQICLGGPAASPIASQLLRRFSYIDYVVRGEGEATFPQLVQRLEQKKSVESVPGITWRTGDQVIANPDAALIDDPDDLPVPAFDSYAASPESAIYLDVGRGCPFKCAFCATAPFWKRRYRMKSIERIIHEMSLVKDLYQRDSVNFSHDIFTCDRDWTKAFCRRLSATHLTMTWSCSTRTDLIDRELLELMADAGCRDIYYGIETGSRSAQQTIDKGLDLNYARDVVTWTSGAGIRPVTGFIIGYPTETCESLNDTLTTFFDFLERGRHRAHLFTLCPFPEAPMYQQYKGSLNRLAEYPDLPLTPPLASTVRATKMADPEIFPSCYRFATPMLPESFVDASESLSCHLVVLKAIWPLLLTHYSSPVDWYSAWVTWIGEFNDRYRPDVCRRLQGSTRDLVNFVLLEIKRKDLQGTVLADLALYEQMKLDALEFDDPPADIAVTPSISPSSWLQARCHFLAHEFTHDLQPFLAPSSLSSATRSSPKWVLVAKTRPRTVDTLQIGIAGVRAMQIARTPTLAGRLAEILAHELNIESSSVRSLLDGLSSYGLIAEVVK